MNVADELVSKLCSSEYFNEFIKKMINTLTEYELNFDEWKSMVILYAKMNKKLPYNYLLKELGIHLTMANLVINEDELDMYNKIILKLSNTCSKNVSDDDLITLRLFDSKIKRLRSYLRNKNITYYDWLKLYDNFLVDYKKIKIVNEDVRRLIAQYINLLLGVNLIGINDFNKEEFYDRYNSLRLIL